MPIKVREPQQLRSMEKKQRILDAGLKCFCTIGYHDTTTVVIAKEAGVSTGLLYSYFMDKDDVLLNVLEMYATRYLVPIRKLFSSLDRASSMEHRVNDVYETLLCVLKENKHSYREMKIAALANEKVGAYFSKVKLNMIETLEEIFRPDSVPSRYHETVATAFLLIESLCLAEIYESAGAKMHRTVLEAVTKLLENIS